MIGSRRTVALWRVQFVCKNWLFRRFHRFQYVQSLAQKHDNIEKRRPPIARYGRQKIAPGKRMRAPASIRAARGWRSLPWIGRAKCASPSAACCRGRKRPRFGAVFFGLGWRPAACIMLIARPTIVLSIQRAGGGLVRWGSPDLARGYFLSPVPGFLASRLSKQRSGVSVTDWKAQQKRPQRFGPFHQATLRPPATTPACPDRLPLSLSATTVPNSIGSGSNTVRHKIRLD